jgi:glycosyltransferase involved in cell wall biosynthesis
MTQPTRSPLVSVVIAAYNEQAYIAEALHSVLAQTHHPIELIVVDDGSTDHTAEITAQIATGAAPVPDPPTIELLRRPHHGPSAARNAGLKRSSGQYWTIFDADDVMPPDRLTHQVAHLQQHPEHDIVLGLTEAFITPGQPKPPHYNPLWDDGPFPGHAGTMMARRAVLDTVGGYDESMALGEDLDWQARAKAAGIRAGALDHVCLHYRIHRANTSSDTRANRAATLQLLRASVQRRRGHETARD